MKKSFILSLLFGAWTTSQAQILTFTSFRTPAQTNADLTLLHTTYPTLTQLLSIGTSVNGNAIRVLKISSTPAVNDPTKGDVVFVADHHAREWISVEMALYLADQLLARYATDPQLQADMNRLQIWIIPVVNPDGYQYSAAAPANRYWRKNRRNNGGGFFGVDLNRNWGYQWGTSAGDPNGSPNPPDDTYFGTAPFSEPETAALRTFLNGLGNFKSFVSYHSYSELYLRPWAHTVTDPPGEQTLRSIAQRNINRIATVHGHTYTENISYTATGEATDFIWNEKRVAAFTPELRPAGSLGLAGFSPAPTEILPCCEENYPAAAALIHDAARSGVWLRDYVGDTGAEPSTGYPWESPDIWTVPAVLNQNATVDLHIRVNNNTGATVNNVTVEAYYTDPRITLEFPSLTSVLIGTAVVSVPPGGTDVVMPWTTPVGTNIWGERHWCVGGVVKHENDMPLTTVVSRTSNVACHNFNTTTIVESGLLWVAATNFLSVAAELELSFNRGDLPSDWVIEFPETSQLQKETALQPSTIRKSKLLETKGVVLEPGQTVKVPIKVHFQKAHGAPVDVRVKGDLLPLVGGKRKPVGNGYSFQVTTK